MIVNDAEPSQEELDNFFKVILAFGTNITRVGYVMKKNYENVSDEFLKKNLNLDTVVKTKVRQDTGGIFFFKKRMTCKDLYNMSRKSDSIYNSLESFHEKILDVTLRK